MDEKAVILRKIQLKRQTIRLTQMEIKKLIGQYGLLCLKEVFEEGLVSGEAEASKKLDAVTDLLEI